MTSNNIFSTLNAGRQAQIVQDCMDLFRSNERGYGVGEFEGAKYDEEKQKWKPGHVRWTWGQPGEQQWRDHLSGKNLLGLGVLCDDGRVWYACLDIDIYEIDYPDEMRKIRATKQPLVVFRTKSGGLRICIFFSEPIEAESVIPRMRRVSSHLGYAGCEIFPKQIKLDVANGDCPSWIFAPFGAKHDKFAEQCCMTDNGNVMDVWDAVEHMKSMRISEHQFRELFEEEEKAKANGKATGKRHPQGAWVEEESEEVTINTMFHDGPICLWIIAHRGRIRDMANNFLMNTATFLKKKYPENWELALKWVNSHMLQPVGDADKLIGIIKRQNEKPYTYQCHDEPIHSFCDPHACRNMRFGVGKDDSEVDFTEWGMTEILSVPRRFFINVDDTRIMLESEDLTNQSGFINKCVANGLPMPTRKKPDEWTRLVNKNKEGATKVEPSHVIRTDAAALDFITRWFDMFIPNFLHAGEKDEDHVRVRMDQRRVYFKDTKLLNHCYRVNFDEKLIRNFISNRCEHHDRTKFSRWWRSTYSISFDLIDEEYIEKWERVEHEHEVNVKVVGEKP